MKDYYKVLGLPFGASDEDVQSVCRRISRRNDKEIEAIPQDIREAYRVLCFESERRRYDEEYARFIHFQRVSSQIGSGKVHNMSASRASAKKKRRNGKAGVVRRSRSVSIAFGRAPKLVGITLAVVLVVSAVFGTSVFFRNRQESNRENSVRAGLDKFSQGAFQEASELLESGSTEDFGVLLKLGASYYNQRKYDEAVSAYEKAIAVGGENAVVYNSLGNVFRDRRETDRAIEMYRKSIEVDPMLPLSYSNLAILLMDSGDREAARTVVDEGLLAIPDSQELKNIGSYIGE